MRTRTRLIHAGLLALSLIAGLSACDRAVAAPYSQFVVFGDSLSDPGNAQALSSGNFPPSPPYAGSFTNGPSAAQYMAAQLGVPVTLGWPAATATSNNYAVGGARNGSGNYNIEIGNPPGLGAAFPVLAQTGLQRQIERYAVQQGMAVPNAAQTLFMVWGGPNDIFLGAETFADPAVFVPQAILALRDDLLMLAGMGARNILVPGMADLGLTPEARGLGPVAMAGLSALSAAYNGGVSQLLVSLEAALAPLDVDLIGFDTAAFFQQITTDPSAYGFTNTTDSCLYTGGPLPGCDGYLYFDRVHPTTAAHRLLAQQFAAAAVPAPATSALVALALLSLVLVRRRRH
jgi:phospholipase/lecithinase/hemolysin